MAIQWLAAETRTLLMAWHEYVNAPLPAKGTIYARFVALSGGATSRTKKSTMTRRDMLRVMWNTITEFERTEQQHGEPTSWFAMPEWEKRVKFVALAKTPNASNSYVSLTHDMFVLLDAIMNATRLRGSPAIAATAAASSNSKSKSKSKSSSNNNNNNNSNERTDSTNLQDAAAATTFTVLPTNTNNNSNNSNEHANPIVFQSNSYDSGSSTESDDDFIAVRAIPSLRRAAESDSSASALVASQHKRLKLADGSSSSQSSNSNDPVEAFDLRREQQLPPTATTTVAIRSVDDGPITSPHASSAHRELDSPFEKPPAARIAALSIASLLSTKTAADDIDSDCVATTATTTTTTTTAQPTAVSPSDDDVDDNVDSASSLSELEHLASPLATDADAVARPTNTAPLTPRGSESARWWQQQQQQQQRSCPIAVVELATVLDAHARALQTLCVHVERLQQQDAAAKRAFTLLVEREAHDQQRVAAEIRRLDASAESAEAEWARERAALQREHGELLWASFDWDGNGSGAVARVREQ